ncbi:disease resistance protein RPM1-like protein [Carex littledalei]|uniref:Disease resistance protein RPM1-like protein n=1 Tax=Carex littledalei TaxID=544730 RepID=A0A833RK34_9POAL|nr:disease resistance protein RPM1-like protein [Carex littledalei]
MDPDPNSNTAFEEQVIMVLKKGEEILRELSSRSMSDVKGLIESIIAIQRNPSTRDEANHSTLKASLRQAREIAYETEDIIQELAFFSESSGRNFLSLLKSAIPFIVARQRALRRANTLRARLNTITQRLISSVTNFTDMETPANATRYRMDDHELGSLLPENTKLIGVDEHKERLISWLCDKSDKSTSLKVKSLVGMGGSGKTTLLMDIYNNEKVRGHFEFQAWINVTPSFSSKELLRTMLNQMLEESFDPLPRSIDTVDMLELTDMISRYLKDKRYIIVFDDVWTSTLWDDFKLALPDNACGSRVIFATRSDNVPSMFPPPHNTKDSVYNLDLLSKEDSWSLFCKTAFPHNSCNESNCPTELIPFAEEIVAKCHGLPLLIVVAGGLLSRKEQTKEAWDNILRDLHRGEMLGLKVIHGSTILWSMVHVADLYGYGKVRSCTVHDSIRDILLVKSEEENFCTSLSLSREVKKIEEGTRRLSIFDANDECLQNINSSNLRALFLFGLQGTITIPAVLKFFSAFRPMRILDLEGVPIEIFPDVLCSLLHLHYLSLRNTKISELPKTLKKLIRLQTLDLKGTYVAQLPPQITELRKLRHLLAYHYYTGRLPPYYYALGVKAPRGIGGLMELQKLTYIDANRDALVLKELARLTQLKRLGIVRLRKVEGEVLCSSVEMMKELLSFSVASVDINEFLDLESLKSPPEKLERLYLSGPLEALPGWIFSLTRLVRLRLRWSKLGQNSSLDQLRDLHGLIELGLIQAYEGAELQFNRGFTKLKMLDLDRLTNLAHVNIKEAAMPNLQKLYIRSCTELRQVPEGIEQLTNLKELHLFDMPASLISSINSNRHGVVGHVPVVRCYNKHERIHIDL